MLTLHHLNHSRSFRILWLLEELKLAYGLEYQLVCHQRDKRTFLAPRALKDIHPMGKAPILVDDDKVLIESGFIIEYLLKYYDLNHQLQPTDDVQWQAYSFWLHFGESSMMPPLVMRLVMNAVATKSPIVIRPVAKAIRQKVEKMVISDTVRQSFGLLENHLQDKHWLAGSFSGADIQVYFTAKALQSRSGLDDYPNIQNWLMRCQARPAFEHAVATGGQLFA